jgi:hypothetical protein
VWVAVSAVQFSVTATGVEVFGTRKITSGTDESKHRTSEIAAHTHTHTQTDSQLKAQWSLYVPHSGHYMYRTVVTICTTSLTFTNATFCPHSVFTCFVRISEQRVTTLRCLIGFVKDRGCVYSAVRAVPWPRLPNTVFHEL